jgi:hypothetical protein
MQIVPTSVLSLIKKQGYFNYLKLKELKVMIHVDLCQHFTIHSH